VVSFLFLSNLLAVLASHLLKRRPRIVVSVRESYSRNLSGIQRFAARLTHRGADLIVFNSMSTLREEQAGSAQGSRVAYLPNAVASVRADAVDREGFGNGEGAVVLSVGQLAPVKGHRILIEAFAAVRETNPGARLFLIGGGPEEERLRALAETTGLSDRVTFLGHKQDPLPFVAGADVFVQPSLSEGMSNALMEAMSLGRCIVATKVGAASELLEHGVHALLPPPTVPDLAAAISRALADPALRHRLGEAARRRAEDFSVDRITSELDTILRAIVQPSSIRSRSPAPGPRS
jgi:glycosyltransferase involved in cell wall biosynthesis